MKTWEEAEFELQQEAIKGWAAKSFWKIFEGKLLKRKLRKIQKLAGILANDSEVAVYLSINTDSVHVRYGSFTYKTYTEGKMKL